MIKHRQTSRFVALTILTTSIISALLIPFNVQAAPLNKSNIQNTSTNTIINSNEIALDYISSSINNNEELETTINNELTNRIDVCKVNTEISNTIDSINTSADDLLAEKVKRDELAEAERKAAERQALLDKYTKDEVYLLAAIIHCEARGESYEGQVAVGAVVLNRVKSDSFPDTIKEVIYQKGQFTPVAKGTLDNVLLSGKINQSCIEAARAALSGENPIGDCLYFRTLNGTEGKYIIGNHVFR